MINNDPFDELAPMMAAVDGEAIQFIEKFPAQHNACRLLQNGSVAIVAVRLGVDRWWTFYNGLEAARTGFATSVERRRIFFGRRGIDAFPVPTATLLDSLHLIDGGRGAELLLELYDRLERKEPLGLYLGEFTTGTMALDLPGGYVRPCLN